jgi:hypothetical protein
MDFGHGPRKYCEKHTWMASRALRLGKKLVFPPTMCGNNSAVQGKNSVVAWKLARAGREERTGSMPISINDDEKRVRCYLLMRPAKRNWTKLRKPFWPRQTMQS